MSVLQRSIFIPIDERSSFSSPLPTYIIIFYFSYSSYVGSDISVWFLFVVPLWLIITRASLVAQMVKHLPTIRETQVRSLGREDPLEKEMATHSSILAWKIPWTEDPGRLQFMGLQKVRHDWATSLLLSMANYIDHLLMGLFSIFVSSSVKWLLPIF